MVESWKAYNGHKAPLYLALLAALFMSMSGCLEDTSFKVINLHFKSASQIQTILTHLATESPSIQFSGNTILIPPNTKNADLILKIIEQVDMPPTSYQLEFNKKNIITRSTHHKRSKLLILEGRETITQYNKHKIKITILKASADSSIINISSTPLDNNDLAQQKNHWLVKHGTRYDIAKDIFPSGFTLRPTPK